MIVSNASHSTLRIKAEPAIKESIKTMLIHSADFYGLLGSRNAGSPASAVGSRSLCSAPAASAATATGSGRKRQRKSDQLTCSLSTDRQYDELPVLVNVSHWKPALTSRHGQFSKVCAGFLIVGMEQWTSA